MTGINEIKKDLKKLKKRVIAKYIETEFKVIDGKCSDDFGGPQERDACYRKQEDEFLKNQIRDPKKEVWLVECGIDHLVGRKDGQDVIQFRDHKYVTDGKKYRRLD